MATVRSLDSAIDLEHRSVPVRSVISGLAAYWNAIREGSAAARAYEELVHQGTPHAEAVARVFEEHFGRR